MITRYLKPIELSPVTSTIMEDLINVIAAEFVSVGFKEVTTPITSSTPAKSVRFENFQIDIYKLGGGNSICFQSYLYYNEENYYSFNIIPQWNLSGKTYKCNLCFFVSNDGKFVSVNIASNPSTQTSKGPGNLFYIITDDEEIVGAIKDTSNVDYYSTNRYNVTFSLKRTYPKEENVFFKDEGVPILKSSDSSYIMDLPYLTTLGGAEAQHTYTMTNGDNYYCLLDNIAVKFDTTVFPQIVT